MGQGQVQAHQSAGDLTGHGGHGGARHLQPGEAEQAEDQDGVQDQVDDRANPLNDHGVHRPAGGLDQPLAGDGQEDTDTGPGYDGQVVGAVADDARDVGLDDVVGPGKGQAQDGEHQSADDFQQSAVHGGAVGPLLILLAQTAGEQGVDAHAGAHRHGDHQVLHREGQRDRIQRVLAQLGHKITVYHIVARLDQHGNDHGNCHVQEQLVLGHDAHFIFTCGL